MEISLEKIELVKDRTGVSYREAKEALEKTEGNVVDAIVLIEDEINSPEEPKKTSSVDAIVSYIKSAVQKGNVSKIVVMKEDDVILNLPVNVGLVGTVLFPWAVVAGCIAAVGTKCTVSLVGHDGEVVNVNEKATEAIGSAKAKGGVILDEVKAKSGVVLDGVKEKSGDAINYAKEAGEKAVDYAKDAGEKVVDYAKEKASDIRWKNPENGETVGSDDFDLSDLDLSGMEKEEDTDEKEEI